MFCRNWTMGISTYALTWHLLYTNGSSSCQWQCLLSHEFCLWRLWWSDTDNKQYRETPDMRPSDAWHMVRDRQLDYILSTVGLIFNNNTWVLHIGTSQMWYIVNSCTHTHVLSLVYWPLAPITQNLYWWQYSSDTYKCNIFLQFPFFLSCLLSKLSNVCMRWLVGYWWGQGVGFHGSNYWRIPRI